MHKRYKTKIGKAIDEYLNLQNEKSFCANDVYQYLEDKEIKANLATIYRNLEQLVLEKKLSKFKTANSDMYQYRLLDESSKCDEHLHIQCKRCGKIKHMDAEFMTEISHKLYDDYGFLVECKDSTLSGICKECRKLKDNRDEKG